MTYLEIIEDAPVAVRSRARPCCSDPSVVRFDSAAGMVFKSG